MAMLRAGIGIVGHARVSGKSTREAVHVRLPQRSFVPIDRAATAGRPIASVGSTGGPSTPRRSTGS
jgi:hypothetical protein